MARNTLRLDTKGFTPLLLKLEAVGGDVEKAVTESLTKASAKITEDTLKALDSSFLPAGGKYSHNPSKTKESVIRDAQVEWEGLVGSIPVGFDFSLPGAGGYLITGTPRMQPDKELNRMYKQKKYMNEIQTQISDVILGQIVKQMENAK